MLFSNGDKNEGEKNKKQSMMGFLFNPNFGADARPMKQAWGMFVRLIAMVFVSFRLFDKEHPALRDDRMPLSLFQVIATARSQLVFTREGLPQIFAFAAVVGALVFSALFLIALVFSMLVGSAHAAAPGMFSVVDPKCDLANKWLDYLFLGQGIGGERCDLNGSEVLIAPSGEGMQKAFVAILNFFSKGILVCAGFILLYHLTVIIADSAQSGKPFGRANALWAPIRLVLAIGLLVPVSTSGLNLGQHMAIQVARWGSNLASQTWSLSLNTILASGNSGKLDTRIPPPAEIVTIVNDIVMMNACKVASNAVISTLYSENEDIIKDYTVSLTTKKETCPGYVDTTSYTTEGPTFESGMGVPIGGSAPPQCDQHVYTTPRGRINCGKVMISNPAYGGKNNDYYSSQVRSLVDSFYQAHLLTLNVMLTNENIAKSAKEAMFFLGEPYDIASAAAATGNNGTEDNSHMARKERAIKYRNAAIDDYRKELTKQMNSALKNQVETEGLAEWRRHGWVMAGAWYNTIARAQAAVFSGAEGPLPQTISPLSGDGIRDVGAIGAIRDTVGSWTFGGMAKQTALNMGELTSATEKVSQALQSFHSNVVKIPYNVPTRVAQTDAMSNLAVDSQDNTFATMPLRGFFKVVDVVGAYGGLWGADDGMPIRFGKTANPLAELSGFGYRNTVVGLSIVAWAGVASAAGGLFSALSLPVISTMGSIVGVFASLALFLGSIFVGAGLTMAFLLPLIPFLKFFYNVLTWLLIVFETVVAAPLFALAHLSPYGDGLPGQAAKGYMLLFSLLLRPALLIVGLVAGFLFFFVSINFLNAAFTVASAGTGSTGGALSVLAKIVYIVMYCVSAYVCANKCFQTISFFPSRVMEWFGGPTLMGRDMGDAGSTTGAIKVAAGYAGLQGLEKMSSGMQSLGSGIGKKLEGMKDKKEKDGKDALAFSNLQEQERAKGYEVTKDKDGKQTWKKIASDVGADDGSSEGGGDKSQGSSSSPNPTPKPPSGGPGSLSATRAAAARRIPRINRGGASQHSPQDKVQEAPPHPTPEPGDKGPGDDGSKST